MKFLKKAYQEYETYFRILDFEKISEESNHVTVEFNHDTKTHLNRLIKRFDENVTLFLGAGINQPPGKEMYDLYELYDSNATFKDIFDELAEKEPWLKDFHRCLSISIEQESFLPTGRQLSNDLAEYIRDYNLWTREERENFLHEFKAVDEDDLGKVSLFFEKTIDEGRRELISELKQHLQGEPTGGLQYLAGIPFCNIVTTNYDQLFEAALRKNKKKPIISIYKSDVTKGAEDFKDIASTSSDNELKGQSEASPEYPFLFKIHGDIEEEKSIVITQEDYIDYLMRMSNANNQVDPIPDSLKLSFVEDPTVFMGYGLTDFNLRFLLKSISSRVDQTWKRSTYSINMYPDPLVKLVYERMTFIIKNTWLCIPYMHHYLKP